MRPHLDGELAVHSLVLALAASALHWSEAVTVWLLGSADMQLITVVLAGMTFIGAAMATGNRVRYLADLRRNVRERGTVPVRSAPVRRPPPRDPF